MATHRLGAQDNGNTIPVQVGDRVIVELDENPTTGFGWAEDELDESRIQIVEDDEDDFLDGGGGIGGGGRIQKTYEPIAPGRAELRLKLWRDWEGDSSILERFAVTLDIR